MALLRGGWTEAWRHVISAGTRYRLRLIPSTRWASPAITDHVPAMVDDTTWGHRGRAYAIGYIRALIDVARRVA